MPGVVILVVNSHHLGGGARRGTDHGGDLEVAEAEGPPSYTVVEIQPIAMDKLLEPFPD